jgi:hypothetical protein
VKGRNRRDLERAHEVEDVLAVVPAPDVEVVLDRDELYARAECAGGVRVVRSFIAPDAVMDLEREGRAAFGWEQDGDLAVARRGRQVACERGDAAAARRIAGNERGTCDDVVLSMVGVATVPGNGDGRAL